MFYNDDIFLVNLRYNDHLKSYKNITYLSLIFLNYGLLDFPLIMCINKCFHIIDRHQVMKRISKNSFETIF